LLSGVTVTLSHLYLKKGLKKESEFSMLFTIILAEFFILFQCFEYITAPFDISDGIYGSTFFMCTGFHGFHVIIGTIFLSVIFLECIILIFLDFIILDLKLLLDIDILSMLFDYFYLQWFIIEDGI
jgi:heme/copper-type cytochrome/quinol oxidase subunit 3